MLQESKFSREQKLFWWGGGEWVDECDLASFFHEDFECLIIRTALPDGLRRDTKDEALAYRAEYKTDMLPWRFFHMHGGNLCGYVKIPKDHPWHGKDPFEQIECEVHGGLTFGDEKEGNYWIGFDCAHIGDLVPSMKMLEVNNDEHHLEMMALKARFPKSSLFDNVYRNFNYVKSQVESLAKQAADAK
jgi:hypothetical protein